MAENRVFLPQEAVDVWLAEERVELEGEVMTMIPEGQRFKLSTALRFMAEVAEESDPNDLVGRIKTLEQVESMEGEYSSGSVIMGDNAYEVIDGFVGEPLRDGEASGDNLGNAARAAVGDAAAGGDVDPLTAFFLGKA